MSERGKFHVEYPSGSNVAIVRITGQRKNCERAHLRIAFPGGDLEVVRATDDDYPDYWCHIRIDHREDGHFIPDETTEGEFVDARLDVLGKHAGEKDRGDFTNPNLYHIAVRVRRRKASR